MLTCRELRCKVQAFSLFRLAGAAPERALARVPRVDAWSRLFVLEGVGYVRGTASGPQPVPDAAARIPVTMGWGLALAVRTLRSVSAGAPPAEALRDLAGVCRDLAPPGLAGVAFEGLGLVARLRGPKAMPLLARVLAEMDGDLEAYFWHGVGRALFFILGDAFPFGSPSGRALERALREPSSGLGRSNALAGLAWAMSLIGLPHPEILDLFLRRHASRIAEAEACEPISQGIAKAALMWCRSAGQDAVLDRFLAYPSEAPERWETWVRGPCERALDELLPALMLDGCWEELFRVAR
ncbi:MAG: hypothetical protein WAM82_32910 [Thermoanaerobaculia bacterium]